MHSLKNDLYNIENIQVFCEIILSIILQSTQIFIASTLEGYEYLPYLSDLYSGFFFINLINNESDNDLDFYKNSIIVLLITFVF